MDYVAEDDDDWTQLAETLDDLKIAAENAGGAENGGGGDDFDDDGDDSSSSCSSTSSSPSSSSSSSSSQPPAHACAYCGLSVPECVLLCESSGRWFCNTPRSVGAASCAIAHLATSRLRACRLHAASPLGDAPLECYSCGGRNPFVLGYVPLRGEDTVLLLCRDTPAAAPGLRGLDVDLGAWAPVVLDRAFVPWLVRPPTDEERHRGKNRSRGRVSVARAAAMEADWRKERGGEGEAREGDGKVAAEEAAAGEPPKPLELEPLRPSYEDGYAFEAALAPCVDAEADEDEAARAAAAREGVTISWEAAAGTEGGAGASGGGGRFGGEREKRTLARIPLPRDDEGSGGGAGRLAAGDDLVLYHATAGGSEGGGGGAEGGGGDDEGTMGWHGVATVLSIGEGGALCEVRSVLPPASASAPSSSAADTDDVPAAASSKKSEMPMRPPRLPAPENESEEERKRRKKREKKEKRMFKEERKAAEAAEAAAAAARRRRQQRKQKEPPKVPTHVSEGWRVQPAAKGATYDRMRRALALFARDERSISPYLYARVLGDAAAAALAPYAPAEGVRLPKSADAPGLPPLNESQAAAVLGALSAPLALIQGPPGTGKSVTCASLAYHLATGGRGGAGGGGGSGGNSNTAAASSSPSPPILVTAPSNVAVDHLAEKIAATGLTVVRVVARAREGVASSVEHLSLTAAVAAAARRATHAAAAAAQKGGGGGGSRKRELGFDQKTLVELGKMLRERASGPAVPLAQQQQQHRRRRGGAGGGDDDDGEGRLESLLRAAERIVLSTADVVCATCAGAGDHRLSGLRFARVMIDEATQATLPEALIPATKGCRQLVLVGDHRQLGPVCSSRAAAAAGFGSSLFERMLELGYRAARLTTQYRMHPALSAFPSDAFYGGSLQNGVARAEREARAAACGVPWPAGAGTPLMFWSVPGREETSSSGTSFLNVSEADAVETVVTSLLRAGGARPDEVGVITPYEGQRARVRHALSSRGPLSQSIYDAVEVASVDGFQGREKEFIVFSAVRTGGLATATGALQGDAPRSLSGAAAGIGFLADPRRLNVALTRARSGVVLIGSPEPLSRHALWAALLARVAAAGAIVEGPLAALRPASAPLAATRGVDAAWWALSGAERKAARAAQAAAVEAAARQAAAHAAHTAAAAAAQQFYGGSSSNQMMQYPQQTQQRQQYYYPADAYGSGASVFAIGGGGIGGVGGEAPFGAAGTYSHF